jgi:phosphate starvation-inducible protein PhoH
MEQQRKVIQAPDNGSLMGLFGSLDENMIKIEKAFSVHIVNREDGIHIIGGAGTAGAEAVIRTMVKLAE